MYDYSLMCLHTCRITSIAYYRVFTEGYWTFHGLVLDAMLLRTASALYGIATDIDMSGLCERQRRGVLGGVAHLCSWMRAAHMDDYSVNVCAAEL